MTGVDSVRWQPLLTQLTNDVPRKIFHVSNVRLGTSHRIRAIVVSHPVILVVVPVFKPLSTDHALVFVLAVSLHVHAECVAGL